ncbi:MAG TPA: nucleotidyltransferase family protein [Vicinamibacterales bacterium]|nr:nucleotidyltransferase family protein [Vicinamibacterales bacterium]
MTRAVVLARGLGTRMRRQDADAALTLAQEQAADAGLKPIMPINGHPFLAYVLNAIADASIRDVALVVAPDHEMLRRHFDAVAPVRTRVSFVVQQEARGTADAVLAAATWTGNDPFLVMNADNLYPAAALRDLAALDEPGFPAFDADDLVASSNIPPERVRAFALAEVDDEGYLTSIVEKPVDLPPEGGRYKGSGDVASAFRRKDLVGWKTYVSMNCWRFDARIYEVCRDVPRSARGEFELPEAVGLAVARGVRFKAVPARGPVLDLSRRADAVDISRRLSGITPWP